MIFPVVPLYLAKALSVLLAGPVTLPTLVKDKTPAPLVVIACPEVPSDVGYVRPAETRPDIVSCPASLRIAVEFSKVFPEVPFHRAIALSVLLPGPEMWLSVTKLAAL